MFRGSFTAVWMMLIANSCLAIQIGADDLACGPRCVQFVLGSFEIQEDLIELVVEIKGGNLDEGASFLSLQHALEERGLHTMPIRTSLDWVLHEWGEMAIVHCENRNKEGHFVVLDSRSRSGNGQFWDGLRGMYLQLPADLQSTENFLLVSAEEIRIESRTPIWRYATAVLILLPFVFLKFRRGRGQRDQNQS